MASDFVKRYMVMARSERTEYAVWSGMGAARRAVRSARGATGIVEGNLCERSVSRVSLGRSVWAKAPRLTLHVW